MSFDKEIRNALAKTVTACRKTLTEDVTNQLQETFGLYPDTSLPLDRLTRLTLDEAEAAQALREQLDHFAAAESGRSEERRSLAYYRLILEIAFTIFNRLAALRLCEDRELVIECVRKGTASDGFRLFNSISGGALGSVHETYRDFLECMMDELALDLGVLFDRTNPQSVVFPTERCLTEVLDLLNDPKLDFVWSQDETIGWIYQYFNPPEERRAMRDASQAPRNSRELAVRNQFFTPRYVVEFLTDNSLGRIWYEMRKGETSLVELCQYLVRRPNEVFLDPGEEPPVEFDHEENLPQEELLKRPVYILHRPKKDPRDIKTLDPACGSAHFLLYDFDLMEIIYVEAWNDIESPASETTGQKLSEDYATIEELRQAVPELILRHNLHGIDIDMRAVQIAAFALWLRAQRAWNAQGLKAIKRPSITKSNIVCAEPMPGESDMLKELRATLQPQLLAQLSEVIFEKMDLGGEAGSLLRIEEEIKEVVVEAKRQWVQGPPTEQITLFPEFQHPRTERQRCFSVREVADGEFWDLAEEFIINALREYSDRAGNVQGVQRRLFAEDAARGLAFLDVCRKRFDVILMNPPFGAPSHGINKWVSLEYPNMKKEMSAGFIERSYELLHNNGIFGALHPRNLFFIGDFTNWRKNVLLNKGPIILSADLGLGVLDDALVEVAATIISKSSLENVSTTFFRLLDAPNKEITLRSLISAEIVNGTNGRIFEIEYERFKKVPGYRISYWLSASLLNKFDTLSTSKKQVGIVRQGLATGDDFRFLRTFWEVNSRDVGCRRLWVPISKGGEYSPFVDNIHLFALWENEGEQYWNFINPKTGRSFSNIWMLPGTIDNFFFKPGASFPQRTTSGFATKLLPMNAIFSHMSMTIFSRTIEELLSGIVLTNSRVFSLFIEAAVGGGDTVTSGSAARRYTQDIVENVPCPLLRSDNINRLAVIGRKIIDLSRNDLIPLETSLFFSRPFIPLTLAGEDLVKLYLKALEKKERNHLSVIGLSHEADKIISDMYQISNDDEKIICSEVGVHPSSLPNLMEISEKDIKMAFGLPINETIRIMVEGKSSPSRQLTKKVFVADRRLEIASHFFSVDPKVLSDLRNKQDIYCREEFREAIGDLLSYLVGSVFGRWDIRIAMGGDLSIAPKLPDIVDQLPICPLGMLVSPNGLPANSGEIASEDWLRVRQDVNTLPPEKSVSYLPIPDSEYPITISWDGILVDDPGWDGGQPHRKDVVRLIREVLELLWGEQALDIEKEACKTLAASDLRDYFRRPSGFFSDHLKRYSMSRRKAPIYWPLSTASGSYTIWIYYSRLTDQTIYATVNDYLEPKISEIERGLSRVEEKLKAASGKDANLLRDKINDGRTLLAELKDFRQEILRIAALPYKPDLNDGVIINAAPFHKLFRLRSWAEDTKEVWNKLENGEYDWSHLAYVLWPDRVKDACRKDRSIAIAHGLEDICQTPAHSSSKVTRGKRGRRSRRVA